CLRVGNNDRNSAKTNSLATRQLRSDRKIDPDHVRDLWITTDSLAIIEKQNRLAARRNLDRVRRYCFGENIDIFTSFETRTVQPNSHSIGIGRGDECIGSETLRSSIIESVPVDATNKT